MRLRGIVFTLAALVVASMAIGCAGSREVGLCAKDMYTSPTLEGDAAAERAAGDAAWAERTDRGRLEEAISSWQRAQQMEPGHAETYAKLARAHYFLADGYLFFDVVDEEEGAEDKMLAVYEKGTYYAELGLGAASPAFRDKVCGGEDVEDVVPTLEANTIPHMYWFATNLGKWALRKGLLVALGNKDKIFAMMSRIDELDASFFHGATGRYFGAYYTKIPFPGGDEEKSQAGFEKSLAMQPNYLATRVLYAELLATKLDDRALFKTQLEYVMNADPGVIPELVAENTQEKKKAELLLEDIDVYFDPPEDE